MNLYAILVQQGDGWTLDRMMFETRGAAEDWARRWYTDVTAWRLVILAVAAIPL
jgi:hypothetical protein